MTRPSGKKFYPFYLFLVILILCLMAYTFLHQAGHNMMAFLSGADMKDLGLFSIHPHDFYDDLTEGVFRNLESLAGPMFPVIIAIILMLLIPKTNHVILEMSKTIFTFLAVCSLMGIIIGLFLFSLGRGGPADIVDFFLQNPGVYPIQAALVCLFLITILLILLGKKANYLFIPGLSALLQKNSSTIPNRKKKVILSLLVLLFLGLAGACLFCPGIIL